MKLNKLNIGAIVVAIVVTALLVGSGVYIFQNIQSSKTKKIAQATLLDQLPLFCSPADTTVNSRRSSLMDNPLINPLIELYLDCVDSSWVSTKHIFFTLPDNPSENREKALYYSMDSLTGLEWQLGDKELQTLTAKSDIPWEKFLETGFGGDGNPVKILDLVLNGRELKILDKPLEFKDGGLGFFQGAKFVLTDLSKGVLTLGGKKFTINLKEDTVQALK